MPTSYTQPTKTSTSFTKPEEWTSGTSILLMESGDILLKEDEGYIILEQSTGGFTQPSANSTSYTQPTAN